jgi:hypothetical protein
MNSFLVPTLNCVILVKSWSRNCPHCIVMKETLGFDTLSLTVTVVVMRRALGRGAPDRDKRILEIPDFITIFCSTSWSSFVMKMKQKWLSTVGVICGAHQSLKNGARLSVTWVE